MDHVSLKVRRNSGAGKQYSLLLDPADVFQILDALASEDGDVHPVEHHQTLPTGDLPARPEDSATAPSGLIRHCPARVPSGLHCPTRGPDA